MQSPSEVGSLVDHLFRHEAGKLISTLSRSFGLEHLDLAEEVVQDAMLQALRLWPFHGIPSNPAAWLAQVARNKALDLLRRRTVMRRVESELEYLRKNAIESGFEKVENSADGEIDDDQLAMIFACCHPMLSIDAQVALTLKVVGGFSVGEIARAFFKQETAVAQRLVRAKRQLAEDAVTLRIPPPQELASRLDATLHVLYLLFNEGYAAHEGEDLIRQDLCGEALRLTNLLLHREALALPKVHALMSLFLIQASRLPARVDEEGELLVLEEQDRSRWDKRLLHMGLRYLDRSTVGEELTTYHVQAGIAAVHAVAPSYEETDWPRLRHLYDSLLHLEGTGIVALNRAVVISMVEGPQAGLDALDAWEEKLPDNYHRIHATRADFLMRLGKCEQATEAYRTAHELCGNSAERRYLERRMQRMITDH